jgi:eukaryotic-like serine/threonine-protein kinase
VTLQPTMDSGPSSGPFGRQDPALPQVFGRYLLVQRLSRGGMGEIFLAKHGLAGFEKLAVIKKVLPHLAADEQFISRFVDEAQVAIKLSHVNVAQVFEVGRVGDEYFLALEYIDGRDLRRTLALLDHRRERLPVDLALFIARELANGLAYAHRRTTSDGASLNLVHCDISPPNVLVSFEGETKVIDFGIAKSAMRGTATDPKVGFGKFGYMAPEQLIRGGVVDHRTDLYAAGVVLFELLTGTRLYEAGPEPDYRALARKVTRGEHALPSEIDPVLAPYDELVATALRPKPVDRFQSAAELRDAIQQGLVAVNPTISTDQLGSYMRALFAEEMTAQRELHARVASAHLSDFQEQFYTQTISTISFALAQQPLHPPDATGRVARSLQRTPPPVARSVAGPSTGRNLVRKPPGVTPSPALTPPPISAQGPTAPPTGSLALVSLSDELEPADTILGMAEAPERPRDRRRLPVIVVSAAVVLLAGFWLSRFTMSTGESPSPVVPPITPPVTAAVTPPADPRALTVQPIPVAPQKAAVPDEIEMTPDDPPARDASGSAAVAVAPPPPHGPREASHRTVHKEPRPAAPAAAFTREQLGQKFQQVRREYDEYKSKFGARLEKEWGELATYIQYMPASDDDAGLREAARRLEAFRARMRE